MKGSCEPRRECDREHGHEERREIGARHRHQTVLERTNPGADDGKENRRTSHILSSERGPDRHPRQERERGQQTFHGFFSETPALSNVAISLCAATAASRMGMASAAPVPSPSRSDKSRTGSTSIISKSAACPGSAER